jgi:integration host factor subunit beta
VKRSDIVRSIQVQFKHMQNADAAGVLKNITDVLTDSIAAGNRVEIRGFGTFQARLRAPKITKNPRTGGVLKIPAQKTILFKASPVLMRQMNWE